MGIAALLSRFGERRKQFREMEVQKRMEERLAEKSMSADEREYSRYLKEEHDKKVKHVVEQIRKKKNKELWHGKTALDAPMIFRREKTMLSEPTIFSRERRIFFYGR